MLTRPAEKCGEAMPGQGQVPSFNITSKHVRLQNWSDLPGTGNSVSGTEVTVVVGEASQR